MRYAAVIFLIVLVLGGFIFMASQNQVTVQTSTASTSVIEPTNPLRPTLDVTYPTGREPIALSPNFRDELIHYMTVDRGDNITRNLYISPAAIDAVRAGEPIPDYTLIAIEAYNAAMDADGNVERVDGHFVAGDILPEIHVAERRSTWHIEDLAASSHLGGWNLAAFDSTLYQQTTTTLNDCFSCHDAASRRQFVFSFPQLQAFANTNEVQYVYCRLPDRQICF